jgi:hypothetical protein
VFASAGWAGSSLLGAGFAFCALAVWAIDRRLPAQSLPPRAKETSVR